jgi:hypothetical protein
MQPSGLRYSTRAAGENTGGYPQIQQIGRNGPEAGRSVSPNVVEDVIANSIGVPQANGNVSHQLGDVQVILTPEGRVATIITH